MARLERYVDMDDNGSPVIDVYTLERVHAIISLYDENAIRKMDNTLAAFFRWVCVIFQQKYTCNIPSHVASSWHIWQSAELRMSKDKKFKRIESSTLSQNFLVISD